MQHLLRNAVFYLDPSGSGLAALTRRGGADSARTVWIVDLGRRYEGRRGSVWDPFGVADYEEGAEEDEFGRERNERIETVEQLWGTTLATYVFDRPVRSFTWISGARFVVVTGDRPVRPAGTLPTAGSNVGGRTLNEATAWDEPAAGSRKFSREDLLSTWHLLQVTRKEHDRPPRAWETAAPEPGAANRISPRTTLAVEQVGTSRRLHLPQLVMPDGVMPLADAGGIAHLDPANISTSGNLFANVLSTAQARMIATVLEPETVPAQPQPSFAARFGRGIMKLAVKAADAYWGTKLEEALDQEPEQERVKSLVRIARVVSAEGDEADWESVDLPGKFARFSPI
ncbi:hypothetical protein DFJ74DRAFT_688272 [Hyaloraphidium curvatum]|nr:hypothetical protein DFJ74DRAFT_688272 [Hyaloraphidium curvatum]